jgi:hypothetical protein
MKTMEVHSFYGTGQHEVEVLDYQIKFSGYGHWKVEFKVEYKNQTTTVSMTTTDSVTIDELTTMQSDQCTWDELLQKAIDTWFYKVEDAVAEWCNDVDEEIEE